MKVCSNSAVLSEHTYDDDRRGSASVPVSQLTIHILRGLTTRADKGRKASGRKYCRLYQYGRTGLAKRVLTSHIVISTRFRIDSRIVLNGHRIKSGSRVTLFALLASRLPELCREYCSCARLGRCSPVLPHKLSYILVARHSPLQIFRTTPHPRLSLNLVLMHFKR